MKPHAVAQEMSHWINEASGLNASLSIAEHKHRDRNQEILTVSELEDVL